MRLKHNIDTKLVFQIGDPMDQGCATYLHNAMYSYANVNAVCLTQVVPKGGLAQFIEATKALNADGFDITMPHKTDIIEFLDECDPVSHAFKCVNHVKIRDGKLIGTGLDGVGMGLTIQHEAKESLNGRHVLIIGAGAVAGPIAADLCTRGITEITVVNRTVEKAQYIADKLNALYGVKSSAGPLEDKYLNEIASDIQLVVQCTSQGGDYGKDFRWLSFLNNLPSNCIVADVLYPTTILLDAAKEKGFQTINGQGMLFHQSLALMDFRFGIKLDDSALIEAEEAVEIAMAIRKVRNKHLGNK